MPRVAGSRKGMIIMRGEHDELAAGTLAAECVAGVAALGPGLFPSISDRRPTAAAAAVPVEGRGDRPRTRRGLPR